MLRQAQHEDFIEILVLSLSKDEGRGAYAAILSSFSISVRSGPALGG